jgi:hypothetical protein
MIASQQGTCLAPTVFIQKTIAKDKIRINFSDYQGTGYPYLYIPKNESHVAEFCSFLGSKEAEKCSPAYGFSLMSHAKTPYFTKGEWNKIKQTIKLNTPGQADGRLTVWVDDKQKFDYDKIIFRSSSKVKINGFLFETCELT